MATFPNGLPVFPVHAKKLEYPKSADRNDPNREIEAICTELGVNPKTISAVAPGASPTSVAQYLDMIASAIQTMTGVSNWYNGDVPMRKTLGWNGLGNTVAASATRFVGFGSIESAASRALVIIPFKCNAVSLYVRTTSTQPFDGSLTFTLRIFTTLSSLVVSVPPNGVNNVYSATDTIAINAGDRLVIEAKNLSASASAGVGGVSLQINQTGT